MEAVVTLEKELSYFDEMKEEWLVHYRGQFAVVKDRSLLGTFTTFDEAFAAGVEAFGNTPFLIRQVKEGEDMAQFPALMVGVLSVYT